MADVTISQLTKGTPAGNNVLPYSTGSNTLGVPVSALFQNTTKIGFNTTDPLYSYHLIYNESADIPGLMLRNNSTPGIAYLSVNASANNCGIKSYNSAHPTKPSYNEIGNWSSEGQLSLVVRNETRMHIDGSGRITKPYQPAFAIQAVQKTYAHVASNFTKITDFSPINQNNINANSSFDFVNGRYIAPVGGIYHISGMLRLDPSPSNWMYAMIFINGSSYYNTGALPSLNIVNPSNSFAATNLSMLVKLNANDILEFYFGASNNNSYTIYQQTCFYGYLLG